VKRIRFNGLLVGAGAAVLWCFASAGVGDAQQAAGEGSSRATATGATTASTPASANSSTTPAANPAATTTSTKTAALAPPQSTSSAIKPSLADFAWLEGRWSGDWGSRVAEQTWLGPKAGEMSGLFRLVEGDKTLVLELFSLAETPEGINFYLRHFTPELVPWEKTDATLLKLESADLAKVVFVNPVNGEPKRTSLIRVDADTYTLRSEIEPEHGDPQVIEITFQRVKPPAAAPSGGSGGHRKKP
jgi:Domain of unknown function (DUF6265)